MAYQNKIRRICLDAMLLCLALMLSYIEAILPAALWIPLPGFKPGLCNIVITLIFVAISPYDAAIVSLCRISIMGILFGNVTSFAFSLAGGILSYLGLWLFAGLCRKAFSMIGISVGCAALHNLGQLTAAALLLTADAILAYLPFLLFASLIFGTLTGVALELITPRVTRFCTRYAVRALKKHQN